MFGSWKFVVKTGFFWSMVNWLSHEWPWLAKCGGSWWWINGRWLIDGANAAGSWCKRRVKHALHVVLLGSEQGQGLIVEWDCSGFRWISKASWNTFGDKKRLRKPWFSLMTSCESCDNSSIRFHSCSVWTLNPHFYHCFWGATQVVRLMISIYFSLVSYIVAWRIICETRWVAHLTARRIRST